MQNVGSKNIASQIARVATLAMLMACEVLVEQRSVTVEVPAPTPIENPSANQEDIADVSQPESPSPPSQTTPSAPTTPVPVVQQPAPTPTPVVNNPSPPANDTPVVVVEEPAVVEEEDDESNYPSQLFYGRTQFVLSTRMNQSFSVMPSVSGRPTTYNIRPSLPAGLSFDSSTGEVTGIPTETISKTEFSIRAERRGRSTETTFELTVNDALFIETDTDLYESDTNPGDGFCLTTSGVCSIRAAVEEATALGSQSKIFIPQNMTLILNSAIQIPGGITIEGEDRFTSIVTTQGQDRAFEFLSQTQSSTLSNFTISDTAVSGPGGAVYAVGGTLNITSMRFLGNHSTSGSDSGGAISMNDGLDAYRTYLTISKSYFEGNSASGSFGGGAVSFDGNQITISDTSFVQNTAQIGGGVIVYGATSTIERNLFVYNTSDNGAGLGLWNGIANIVNNTFSQNSSVFAGGAIGQYGSTTASLTNNTFFGNSADLGGGSMWIFGGVISTRNNLFESNYGTNGDPNDCLNQGTINNLGNNLTSHSFGESACGMSLAKSDIERGESRLNPLSDNGGSTLTHAILGGSHARGKGSNTGCPSRDGRNMARSGSCDIGAFEY